MYLDLNSWLYRQLRSEATALLDQLSVEFPVITHDSSEATVWFPKLLDILGVKKHQQGGLCSRFYATIYDPTKTIMLDKCDVDLLVGIALACELVTLPKALNTGLGITGRYAIDASVVTRIRGNQVPVTTVPFVGTNSNIRELLVHLTILRVLDSVAFVGGLKNKVLTKQFLEHKERVENPDDTEALTIEDLGAVNVLLALAVFNGTTQEAWDRYKQTCRECPLGRCLVLRGNADFGYRAGTLDRLYFQFGGLGLIPAVGAALAEVKAFGSYTKFELLIDAYEQAGIGRETDVDQGLLIRPGDLWMSFAKLICPAIESNEAEEDVVLSENIHEALQVYAGVDIRSPDMANRERIASVRAFLAAKGMEPDEVSEKDILELLRVL